jgi:hypothetical protein
MPGRFWGIVVHPETPQFADFREDVVVRVTNVCIQEPAQSPIRLFALVETVLFGKEPRLKDSLTMETEEILLASFIPGQRAQQSVSFFFCPLDKVTFPVHVSLIFKEIVFHSDATKRKMKMSNKILGSRVVEN